MVSHAGAKQLTSQNQIEQSLPEPGMAEGPRIKHGEREEGTVRIIFR